MQKPALSVFEFDCAVCGKHKTHTNPQNYGGTGYAQRDNGEKVCYACCGDVDRAALETDAKIVLYVVRRDGLHRVQNWCGTLDLPVTSWRYGKHNIAGTRLDVWFTYKGHAWHGINLGSMQILSCRKVKA